MSGSSAEREIRDAVAERLRSLLPGARIVHELVVGQCRADLAAIGAEEITLVEIKSERDKLTRLDRQVKTFGAASHRLLVVAHDKWFDRTPYNDGRARFAPSDALGGVRSHQLWRYPEPGLNTIEAWYGWRFDRYLASNYQPHAALLLGLLWKYELLAECHRHRIAAGTRTNMVTMIRDMAWRMTGAEIARAVCRQLRQRHFPEADAAIVEPSEQAA